MNEQTKRFRGLRRVTKEQEGLRSPSYQVHKLHFDLVEFNANGYGERKIEVEATDLYLPYEKADFKEPGTPAPRFPLAEIEFFLNESKNDLIIINQYDVPKNLIRNFPFYKVTFRIITWPQAVNGGLDFVPFTFYTLTDPRIIQALGAR